MPLDLEALRLSEAEINSLIYKEDRVDIARNLTDAQLTKAFRVILDWLESDYSPDEVYIVAEELSRLITEMNALMPEKSENVH